MDDRGNIYLDKISIASDASFPFKRSDQIEGSTIGQKEIGKYGQNDEVSTCLLLLNKEKTVIHPQSTKHRTWRRFQDGERTVDFVLAYAADDPHPRNADKRKVFEKNLETAGLKLEREETQKIHFVNIHAPKEILCRYCEILKIKMPMKEVLHLDDIIASEFEVTQSMKYESENKLFHLYSRNHKYLFDVDSTGFFDQLISIEVVQFILERERFDDVNESHNNFGIGKLLSDGVYEASYPLHDGDFSVPGSQRSLLFNEWASLNKWYKHQPLDNIKDYFGVKIALYFAWLGFYTKMLIPASLVGILCFLYGLITLFSNTISEDICNPNNDIIMCPQCDEQCDYWYLKDTCIYSRISYLFDNNMTVLFACFTSFWAVLYLELWKRHSAKLIHRWGLADFSLQAEHPRPQYLSRLRKVKSTEFNVVRRCSEPHVPFWKVKFPIYVMSYSVILLFICIALAAIFGATIYRMSLMYSRSLYDELENTTYKQVLLPATAAILDLVIITVLNYLYDYLSVCLTNMEYRRTQTEYDESLTLKNYLFQFVNYYSSIFYIACLKGKLIGHPAKYNRIFGLRQEECSSGGCLMELCIQLVVIMVGDQALNSLLEMLIPFLIKTFKTLRNKMYKTDESEGGVKLISYNQWTSDFKLLDWSSRGLFDDYLEMIIQYGFVTIFVVAFPLAPLFALLNNIFEMRLDAKKFLKYYRRPVPHRVKGIGVWFNIMDILGRIAVVSSAFIIAFSSNFIPRMVYMMQVNANHTDEGYLNHALAFFNTSDFENGAAPLNSTFENVLICRYREYRNPPWSDAPYKRPDIYWHILAARLAFFVVFQSFVGFVQMAVAWAIPDVPRKLGDRIQLEEYATREIIIENELQRASAHEGDQKYLNVENVANTEIGDFSVPGSQRSLLFNEWASLNKWYKHQPLDNIKDYFGVKIALYFAWLGFYTKMLIPASLVGILCFLYGLITLFSNTISEDICNPNNDIIMCPQCDEQCDYWYLKDTCIYSRISYLFDNNMTVLFACFTSFWAVLYLELWKRHSAKLIHRWGLADFSLQAEHPRPQYLSRLRKVKSTEFNVVRRCSEPHVPFWKVKFPIYVMSYSVILLFICIALAAIFGATIYRMSLMYSRSLYDELENTTYKQVLLPATAAILDLVIITVLNYLYDYLSVCLTNMEYRRTQTEYDESLTLKNYLFQFVNYYSSIFYIACLKGKLIGHPAKYNRIFGLRQEECSSGGCLMELCIQLVVIMVGDQALNSLLEMLIPFLIKTFKTLRNKMYKTDESEGGVKLISYNQWTSDFKLLDWSSRGLFDDYLEMIIQYGFVTIFVVAFPLAPLFALLNNIFEMRLDAKKFLKYYRRPVPHRVKGIGVWFNIMDILGRIAVVSSAFIIAFSSNFIPRMVYMMQVNANHTDEGYLNHALAFFNTSDFENGAAPLNSTFENVLICRYREYRNPPWSDAPYKRPDIYWHILAARLAFFVVFQSFVGFVQMAVAWAIPDVPRKLGDRIQLEEYATREIIIENELQRASAHEGDQKYLNVENVANTEI